MARETRRRREETTETIKIKIAPLFAEVKEYTLPVDSTVEEALNAAGISTDVEVRLAGNGAVEMDSILEDGDEITVVSNAKVEAGN